MIFILYSCVLGIRIGMKAKSSPLDCKSYCRRVEVFFFFSNVDQEEEGGCSAAYLAWFASCIRTSLVMGAQLIRPVYTYRCLKMKMGTLWDLHLYLNPLLPSDCEIKVLLGLLKNRVFVSSDVNTMEIGLQRCCSLEIVLSLLVGGSLLVWKLNVFATWGGECSLGKGGVEQWKGGSGLPSLAGAGYQAWLKLQLQAPWGVSAWSLWASWMAIPGLSQMWTG